MSPRRTRITLAVTGAVMVAGGVLFRVLAWPSMAFPDTDPAVIEARWAEVERRAGIFGAAATRSPHLVAGADALDGWPEADEVLRRDASEPPIDATLLDPAGRRALDALLQWAAEEGEVNDTCMRIPPPAFALFRLASLGLRSAVAADDPPFTAALRLAAALRQRGPLLDGVMGFELADDALEIARARGWDARETLTAHRPTREELRSLVARESVCTHRVISRIFELDCDERGTTGAPWFYPLSTQRWCARERQVFKDYWGARHESADAFADLDAFADALALEDLAALPPSPTLRATAVSMDKPVRDAFAVLARYDALAGESPRGTP